MSGTVVVDDVTAEQRRLVALHDYDVLDSPPESDFDDIVALAAQLCGTPGAGLSLIAAERQWLKARIGVEHREIGREQSFCAYAIRRDEVLEVPDARLDPRFRDNPLVAGDPQVRFYAGAPLISPGGHAVGALWVSDHEPRRLTPTQREGLRALARHVTAQLELRRYARGLDATTERLRDAGEFLARATQGELRGDSDRIARLVDDILLAAEAGPRALEITRTVLDLGELARAAAERNAVPAGARGLTIRADAPAPVTVAADEPRLAQALERLVLSAVRYTPQGEITVRAEARGDDAVLEVRDTGVGMSRADRSRVLARSRPPGAGLGLTIVKAIVDSHGGTIAIESEPGRGTTVTVTLPRHRR